MESDKIDISKHLVRFEEVGCSLQMAEDIKNVLRNKDRLRDKNNQYPTLGTSPTHSPDTDMGHHRFVFCLD